MHDGQTNGDPGYLVKLVRDAIPFALGGDGTVTYARMDAEKHRRLLRRKLIEEAVEFLDDPCPEELADVLAVVDALARVEFDMEFHELVDVARDKASKRGGFLHGVGMFARHPKDGG